MGRTNISYTVERQAPKCFDATKCVIRRELLLGYPDFNATFEIHTNASKLQLGTVISQKGKPITFYSRKMNSSQQNYSTTEKELLSIVETLKGFRNILLGHQITVYTDHKNLTSEFFKYRIRNALAPNTQIVWPWIEIYQGRKQRRCRRSLLPWK